MTAPASPSEDHRLAQTALVSRVADMIANAWANLVDVNNLKGSLPKFTVAAQAVAQQYGQASSAGALSYYRAERLSAGIPGRPTFALAPPPPVGQMEATVSWSTKDLWGPDVHDPTKGGVLIGQAQDRVAAATERIVLNQGRDTIINTVHTDKRARGWARVTEPGACSFCLLLATRGAVYKSESSAEFQAHDHCECGVEPLFGNSYEPSAQVRAAQSIYRQSTKGKSNADARNSFRVAINQARANGHPLL